MKLELSNDNLAEALRQAVLAQQFETVIDSQNNYQPVAHFPSIDLAVAAFPDNKPPVYANVLFSRELTNGHIANIDVGTGKVCDVHYLCDQVDDHKKSFLWDKNCDWQQLRWRTLTGQGTTRFVSPYPASLIKLMVAVGVAYLVDRKNADWEELLSCENESRTIAALTEAMLISSNNDATTALVSLLHQRQLIERKPSSEINHLNNLFQANGLVTLQLNSTQSEGGWGNGAGAGVGQLCMTSWDTVRLLWLLRDALAPPFWTPVNASPLLSAESRARLWHWLGQQGLHEVLSSTALAGIAGWQQGIPAAMPERWIDQSGGAKVEAIEYPPDIRSENNKTILQFSHKTGTTENYASDAGFVTGIDHTKIRRRYLISIITNLGTRYAPDAVCATTWHIPRLGRTIDNWLAQQLEV